MFRLFIVCLVVFIVGFGVGLGFGIMITGYGEGFQDGYQIAAKDVTRRFEEEAELKKIKE